MKLKNSKKIYYRSKKVLSGPSTFSKGVDQFAYGISPYAISHETLFLNFSNNFVKLSISL